LANALDLSSEHLLETKIVLSKIRTTVPSARGWGAAM
jgi:hypothetical protein